jgi:hypothetical protein
MGITLFEVKESEISILLQRIRGEGNSSSQVVSSFSSFVADYAGDIHAFLRMILTKLKSDSPQLSLIFLNTHLWFRESLSDDHAGLAPHDEDDSDDDGGGDMGLNKTESNLGLLYRFLKWCNNSGAAERHEVSVVFEHAVPKWFKQIRGVLVNSSSLGTLPLKRESDPMSIEIFTNRYDCSLERDGLTVIGLVGSSGSGRTYTLQSIAKQHKCVWMHCHEIVDCELGQSTRIVRSLFRTASSKSTPSVVLLDNADLILNTTGRIMKEITEEIGVCVSEFSRGFFVYTSTSESGIPEYIRGKTAVIIRLGDR